MNPIQPVGMMVVMAMIATCGFGCMMLLPYVGTVVVPVLVFKRSYSLYFLAQFGRACDVFPPTAPLPATPPTM